MIVQAIYIYITENMLVTRENVMHAFILLMITVPTKQQLT